MSDRFYTPHPLAPGDFVLDGPEAHHLAHVRRFGAGDRVTLFNGDGHEYPAEVASVGKKAVALAVLAVESPDRELPFPVTIAAALPKGDRGDFLVEKLTELGVTRFVPLVTARSVVVPKVEKLDRAVIEASKQCGRNVLMRVAPATPWGEFVKAQTGSVLHTTGGEPLLRAATVAVGPEGGFTADELALAVGCGWRVATLGPRVLRVETAAVAAAVRVGSGARPG